MREIKFRGYSKENKKWIYGCLLKCWSIKTESFVDNECIIVSQNNNDYYSVDENSIGQYTGFKDNNGVEIYEGDIFVDTGNYKVIVYFNEKIGRWDVFNEEIEESTKLSSFNTFYEVIGNIYEKKLKEGK